VPKALVVDDDAPFRLVMRSELEKLAFSVSEFCDGRGVAAFVRTERPSLCVIELVMPEKEGIETILEIVELDERPTILAISARWQYLDAAEDLGAEASLGKPFGPEELREALRRLSLVDA
jgi:two-component system phosphate regulon response regulator OmpR